MRNKTYNIVNIIIAMVCAIIFGLNYWYVLSSLIQKGVEQCIIIFVTMALVMAVKYIRLYFVFYGSGLSLDTHTKLFFKTTIVNILIPFKLGDIFRGYCYGQKLENYIKGFCYILLDRFMDTLALVTLVMFFSFTNKMPLSTVFCIMVAFLIVLIAVYFTFPALFAYWNAYFIRETATKNKIMVLNTIQALNDVYGTLKDHIFGRGVILYILSLTAWVIEGIGFFGVSYYGSGVRNLQDLSRYLGAALGIGELDYQKLFIVASMIISILFYIIYKTYVLKSKEKNK